MIGNGSIPQLNTGAQSPGSRALFYSVRDIALILDKTVKAGYGVLRAGTLMSVVAGETDAADYGKLVPYAMTNASAVQSGGNAKAYLAQDYDTGTTTCEVTNEESYKLTLGDHIIFGATGETSLTGGEITGLARSATTGICTITHTAVASAVFTVAGGGYVIAKAAAAAPFSTAVYVLDQDVDSGVGADAAGALTSVVVSNAILYKAVLDGINGETAGYTTDMGGVADGRFVILK